MDVSLTVFGDIDAFSSKIASPSLPCLTPPSGGAPCDINVIYTPLKSTLNGLQFRRGHYGSIFIRSAVVGSQAVADPGIWNGGGASRRIDQSFDLVEND